MNQYTCYIMIGADGPPGSWLEHSMWPAAAFPTLTEAQAYFAANPLPPPFRAWIMAFSTEAHRFALYEWRRADE